VHHIIRSSLLSLYLNIQTRNTIRDCIFYSSTAEAVKRMPLDQRYSLAIASYTLSELPNDLSRRVAVQLLFESLEVGGYLVVLEAGHPFGSHTTRYVVVDIDVDDVPTDLITRSFIA
jgi:ribosomal protein RSM22 (predicted rRNA methylase)